jgi:hypothetical protein
MVYSRAVKVSVLKKVLPHEMRSGKAYEILNKRNEVMEVAKIQYPERWGSQKTKVWKAAERVVLNKDKTI